MDGYEQVMLYELIDGEKSNVQSLNIPNFGVRPSVIYHRGNVYSIDRLGDYVKGFMYFSFAEEANSGISDHTLKNDCR